MAVRTHPGNTPRIRAIFTSVSQEYGAFWRHFVISLAALRSPKRCIGYPGDNGSAADTIHWSNEPWTDEYAAGTGGDGIALQLVSALSLQFYPRGILTLRFATER